ncbi:integrase core domain protein [Trichonephila clavipes]|uniref:Integrase core domain protein n=1 Tax=Trichonephila clavipes TaxID=2585209 RepID=A0A8X7BJM8_TRICX|nr:integrase core domain protein [Trichonephila clavipes]
MQSHGFKCYRGKLFLQETKVHRQAVLKDLRKRFRFEYLGSLIQRKNKKSRKFKVSVGEIVMVGADNKKRIIWPLGRITETIPCKDGQVRLVIVRTSQQEFLHPIQRIYSLQISSSDSLPAPMIWKSQMASPKLWIVLLAAR